MLAWFVTSTSRYQIRCKVDPPRTAEVDSTELANVLADWLTTEAQKDKNLGNSVCVIRKMFSIRVKYFQVPRS